LGVPVIAVEVAADMRHHFMADPAVEVHLLGGRAEALPFAAATFEAVWASQVIHHVDIERCAREVVRVLVPSGRLLVRGGFDDAARPSALHRFFPELKRISGESMAILDRFRAALESQGLRERAHEVVQQTSALSLAKLAKQAAARARSPLRRLSDEEFCGGLKRLRAAAAAEETPEPVVDSVDLVVFG
jgi:ubiquinone/menaquinone biosynthesis C-methylase UbiE